jgi:DNA-binding transcriptional LysR family regulator
VLPFIPTLQKKYPKIKFIPIKVQLTDIEEYLNKSLCDVVLSYETNLTLPNITRTKIIDGNYNVLVSTNHPLAKRKSVTAREAYEHPVILLSENCIGEVHDYMLNRLKEINIKPIIAKEVDDIENAIFYIISENLLGFVDNKADLSLYIDSLVSIPLTEDVHKYCICASYNKDSKHPILNDFVTIISQ